jgi:hypothetical protein
MSDWKSYDPTRLVELAKQQLPEEGWLPTALSMCTVAWQKSDVKSAIDPSHPNEPGSEWQFEVNLILEDPIEGDLVLDILSGNRVGGIEFWARLHFL